MSLLYFNGNGRIPVKNLVALRRPRFEQRPFFKTPKNHIKHSKAVVDL